MPVFWLRSVRRRPAASVVLALVSMLAVAAAVLSPLLLRSVQEAAVARAAMLAGPAETGVFGVADADPGQTESALGAAVAIAEGAGHPSLWSGSTAVVESNDPVTWTAAGRASHSSAISAVGSDCGGIRITAGACATGTREVLVSATTGLQVGDVVVLPSAHPVRLRVVGVGAAGTALAWAPLRAAGLPEPAAGPALVVTLPQLDELTLDGTAVAERPLAHALRLEDAAAARDGVREAREAALTSEGAATNGRAIVGIGDVLDAVQPALDAAAVLLGLAALDAVGLGWFATAAVVQRLGRARAAEWGLSRLRALPARRRAASAVLEPGIAIVVGALLGAPLGVAAAVAVAPGPVDPLRPLVAAAAGLALLGSLVALVVAALTSGRAPLGALLRATTEQRRAGRVAVAAQVAVVLAAALTLASLLGGGDVTGISLLVPVLLALVVGVLGARVVALLLGRPARRAPGSVVALLAGRRIARSPSVLTGAAAVLVGVAVAAFAVQLSAASALAQQDRAAATVGAGTVLTVSLPADASLRAVVDAADPSGRVAMAAEELQQGRDVGRLLAVDTARLAAVTSWRADWAGMPLDTVARRLAPTQAAPLMLTGTRLRLRLADVGGGHQSSDPATLRLRAIVAADRGWTTVDLGAPHDGVVQGPAPCSGGCRLVALQAVGQGDQPGPFSLDVTITAVSTDRQAASRSAARLVAAQWRNRIGAAADPSQPASASVSDASPGLAVAFDDETGGGAPSIAVRDTPEPVPVLLGPVTATEPFAGVLDAVSGIGLDQQTLLLHPIGRASVLPRTLRTGALADLGVLERSSDPAHRVAAQEVWLVPGAHPAVERRLIASGARIRSRETLAGAERRFDREAPALAAAAAPLAGAAGVLLVLLARLGGGLLDAPARRRDAAALRLAGVPRGSIRRAAALEAALPLAGAVVLGVLAGLAAFLLVVPHLVLVTGPAPPLDAGIAAAPVALLVAGCVLPAAVVVGIVARAETPRQEGA